MSFSSTGPNPVEVYASTTSVMAGDTIGFQASVTPAAADNVTLAIYRSSQLSFGDNQFGIETDIVFARDYRPQITVNSGEVPVFQTAFPAANFPIPANASQGGCNWPQSASWDVPADQPSSMYLAQVTHGSDVSYATFVVRPSVPGQLSKVVVQHSDNTYQAYNPWGGSCFYVLDVDLDNPALETVEVTTVSFDRPCQLWDYLLYEEPIVTWLEANTVVEFCANADLDSNPGLLNNYQLLISCGHDEYWSAAMRDAVEAFANGGGNVLALSGNTSYRPVSFNGRQMTLVAGDWAVNGRDEALTFGINWSAGLWTKPLPARGYNVVMPLTCPPKSSPAEM